jgi:hypothetical protein
MPNVLKVGQKLLSRSSANFYAVSDTSNPHGPVLRKIYQNKSSMNIHLAGLLSGDKSA